MAPEIREIVNQLNITFMNQRYFKIRSYVAQVTFKKSNLGRCVKFSHIKVLNIPPEVSVAGFSSDQENKHIELPIKKFKNYSLDLEITLNTGNLDYENEFIKEFFKFSNVMIYSEENASHPVRIPYGVTAMVTVSLSRLGVLLRELKALISTMFTWNFSELGVVAIVALAAVILIFKKIFEPYLM